MRLKPRADAPVLDADVVRILLSGWSATPREPADEVFDLFLEGAAGIARLWRAHEPWLREEARRLEIAPSWSPTGQRYEQSWSADDGLLYFGEYIARSNVR